MEKFRVCPRCDKRYWFKRYICLNDKCSFLCFHNNNIYSYGFSTEKYTVGCNIKGISDIFLNKKSNGVYNYTVSIKRMMSPKATDEDIEKLLLLQ
jgi:hypothetical protein